MLVDVQTRNDIAVIDPRTYRVIRRVALPGCDHTHGLLVDAPRRLAFVACDGNARSSRSTSGHEVTGRPRRLGPDVLAFDPR